MKKLVGLLAVVCLTLAVTGCGGSKDISSSVENAGDQALADYQKALEEEEAAMNADAPKE